MTDVTTRAVMVTAHGGTEVLEVAPRTVGPPQPGEVQVRVAASGINFIDTYQRKGIYPIQPPFALGGEGAGQIIALGDGVQGFAVGDIVAWASTPGSHSGVVNAAADNLVPVPDGVSAEVAAAVMLQGMTAHYLVWSTFSVQPGDTALVHAAAGGVGQLLVQMAKGRGAIVIGTVSTQAKQDKAEQAGADEVIRYDQVDDLAAEVRQRNGGRGVSVVYDGVGKSTFDASLASLGAPRHDGALRRLQRPGAAVRSAAAQLGRLAVPDPADPRSLHGHPRRVALAWWRGARRGSQRCTTRRYRRPLPDRRRPPRV